MQRKTANRKPAAASDPLQPSNDPAASGIRTYLLNSTLHGLRYVGQTTISTAERCFFAASFALVVVLAGYFITNVYVKWRASPLIISMSAAATPITEFPFPAVTFCNMNQARRDVVARFKRGSNDALLMRSMCGTSRMAATVLEQASDTSWRYFQEFLRKVSRPCGDMLVSCKFGTRPYACAELFDTVLTDEGVCCIFNGVHKRFLLRNYSEDDDNLDDPYDNDPYNSTDATSTTTTTTTTSTTPTPNQPPLFTPIEWTPESGFPADADRFRTYPRRALGSGSHMGLTVLMDVHVADYYCSSTNSAGFKVLMHPPTETPKIADYGFAIAPGRESRVVVTPMLADAARVVRDIPLGQRQCVFADEANLTYYRTYSRKNCEMECESRLIGATCGCVLYYMPRVDENTIICSRDDIECSKELKLVIQMGQNATFRCDCLPGCFEISYRADVSTAGLSNEFRVPQVALNLHTRDYVERNLAVVHVFYEENFFRASSKDELIGFTEFLSNTGGLLGLFMGFSVVSIIEIVYFLTLRPYCAAARREGGRRPVKLVKHRRRTAARNVVHQHKQQPFVRTISFGMDELQLKPFAVNYRPVRRRLCDMDVAGYGSYGLP